MQLSCNEGGTAGDHQRAETREEHRGKEQVLRLVTVVATCNKLLTL